jgi:lysophospholipase L1-like esterase
LADGIHPNRSGVAKIVAGILPSVEAVLDQISAARASSGAAGNR